MQAALAFGWMGQRGECVNAPPTLPDLSEVEQAGAPSMALLIGKNHPLRATLSAEMHLRKFPDVPLPARILQVVCLISPDEVSKSIDAVQAYFGNGSATGDYNTRHFSTAIGKTQFSWERHSEFCTYTCIVPFEGDKLFSLQSFEGVLSKGWLSQARAASRGR